MDNWVGGGPLPNPDRLFVRFATRLERQLSPGSGAAATGATRAFAGWSGQWKAVGPNGTIGVASLSIEVNYFVDPAWGKQPGTPTDVITYRRGGAFGYYVALNGARLVPYVGTSPGAPAKELSVNWSEIIRHVIAEKLFPEPVKGWGDADTATAAAFVGSEVYNPRVGTGGPMADLFIADFEEYSL